MDPYKGVVEIGKMVRKAAAAAVHDETRNEYLQRLNDILAGEDFVDALTNSGCMITRIPSRGEEG